MKKKVIAVNETVKTSTQNKTLKTSTPNETLKTSKLCLQLQLRAAI